MTLPETTQQLCSAKCVPCEGGVPKLTASEIATQLQLLSGWTVSENPDRICKSWTVKHFMAGMHFLNAVAELSEQEAHHPDIHLAGYRNLSIEIWTHAIGGLSLNDFVLAAKIDQLPIQLKPSPA